MVVFEQGGFIRAEVVVFGQKMLYPGKSDFDRSKEIVVEKSCCIRE